MSMSPTNQCRYAALGLLLAAVPAAADSLTIYGSGVPGSAELRLGMPEHLPGFALVRTEREPELVRGRNRIVITGVAARLDPTSPRLDSLTDPEGVRTIELGFEPGIGDAARLVEQAVGREITVEQAHGANVEAVTGTLLGTSGGLILKMASGEIRVISAYSALRLRVPQHAVPGPALVWTLEARTAGRHRLAVSYETDGMAWWADYVTVLSAVAGAECRLDVSARATLVNRSGVGFDAARVRLVAGDVRRAPRAGVQPLRHAAVMAEAAAPAPAESALDQYHVYDIPHAVDIPDDALKQIELMPEQRAVPCRRELAYQGLAAVPRAGSRPLTESRVGTGAQTKVESRLTLRNDRSTGLGVPLPAGRVRVLGAADGRAELLGEDSIGHTPENATLRLRIGHAFDVTGERRQAEFRIDNARRQMEEDIEVTIANARGEPVTVSVLEPMFRWTNWRIVRSSHEPEKEDAGTARFAVRVAPKAEAVLRYTVAYSW